MNKQQNEEKNTPDVFKSLLEELNQAGYKLSGNIVVNIYRSGSQHVDRVENQYIGIRPTKATAKSKATAPKSAPKPTTPPKSTTPPNLAPLPDSLRSQLRDCLALLMQERFGSEPLLNRQSHWQAVYRILVDKGYCADSDFNGFDSFIRGVMPEVVNKPYTKGSVKMISQTPFVRPFGEWKFDPLIFKTRKPFERMVAVASRFLTLMDEHGLVKKRPNS
jgi:hypothetical protein